MKKVKYSKLKPKAKKAWIKALKSKKYDQARGYLCVADPRKTSQKKGFCCLGIAWDVLADRNWKEKTVRNYQGADATQDLITVWVPDVSCNQHYGGLDNTSALPYFFQEEIGLDRAAARTLAMMNDHGKSFKKIAKWIKKEL